MADAVHDAARLKELQALPLDRKIQISQARIIEWYQRNHGNVVVSFSGGKDSTVLLHLVRSIYPDVPAVFSNTGLEYPEIQRFVRTFPNVEIVAPKMNFSEVISTYGYPLIGKEVAEAIYYARRIRSQSVHVEREREREQGPHNAPETCGTSRLPENDGGGSGIADENSTDSGHFIDTSGAKNRRTILSGKWGGGICPNAHARNILGQRSGDRRRRGDLDGTRGRASTAPENTADGIYRGADNLQANRTGGAERKPLDGRLLETRNMETMGPRRETTNRGKWGDYHRRSLNPDAGNPDDLECFFNRKTEWSDWRRGCL